MIMLLAVLKILMLDKYMDTSIGCNNIKKGNFGNKKMNKFTKRQIIKFIIYTFYAKLRSF